MLNILSKIQGKKYIVYNAWSRETPTIDLWLGEWFFHRSQGCYLLARISRMHMPKRWWKWNE